jgi:hypothetical protein
VKKVILVFLFALIATVASAKQPINWAMPHPLPAWRIVGEEALPAPDPPQTLHAAMLELNNTFTGTNNTFENVLTQGPDPVIDVVAYGADPTNTSDSLAGVEAAMTAACALTPGSGAIVYFPPGKYQFSNIIPSTSSYWCSGLTIKGAGIRATELDFPTGSGYAITEAGGTSTSNDIRNLTISDFLMVVGGGSGGSNNGIGGIFIGNYAFTHEYRNLYIIGPTTSTAAGISLSSTVPPGGTEDSYVSTLDFDNVRVDNFGGTSGYGFYFEMSGTGDLLHCHFCYSNGAYIGLDLGFFWTAVLDQSDVDNSIHYGFYLHPGNGNTAIGNGLSGEVNQGDLYLIYGNGAGTVGGSVILTNPKSSGENASSSSFYPIRLWNFAGDATIINPVTTTTGGSAVASLDITGTPHAVTIVGCDQLLDLGFSSGANTYLSQGQGNVCSNTQGSLLVPALAQPATPTVTPTCTGTCTSTWAYEVVVADSNGYLTQASAAGSTAANASTLDSTHYNTVTFTPTAGARYYKVYRTTSGGTPANLSLVCNNLSQGTALSCKDNGTVNTGSVTPSATNSTGTVSLGGAIVASGTAASLTGTGSCATITTQSGGNAAGTFKCTGTTGASTITITPGLTAPNGWTCDVWDETTPADNPSQTSHTATTCVVTSTSTAANDVFSWKATAY